MTLREVRRILRSVKVHPAFPYPTEFLAHDVSGGFQVEARTTMVSVETGKPQKGIFPDYCSVVVGRDASARTVKRAAVRALAKFLAHEAAEVLTDENGEHIVEPHPEARAGRR